MDKKVSIITPCYNGEKYVHRFLESILNQTYTNIELIFVNDGSIDKTEDIVIGYESKFKERGIELIYIYQENKGLAGAINSGLKIFKGEYLCWPDSDDFLSIDSIKKRVEFLENNKEYGCVSSNANLFKMPDLKNKIGMIANNKERFEEWQFEHLLNENSIFCPGCHMIRSENFLDVNPCREIFPAKRGQNWQMLLPLYYKYKRGFIDDGLYNYIIYPISMSQGDDTLEKCLFRIEEHEEILINTLNRMQIEEKDKEKYMKYISNERYIRKRLELGYKFNDLDLLKRNYNVLKEKNNVNITDIVLYYSGKYKLVDILYRGSILGKRILGKIGGIYK